MKPNQDPPIFPHGDATSIRRDQAVADRFSCLAKGGLSRWGVPQVLEITGFSIHSPKGVNGQAVALDPLQFRIVTNPLSSGTISCRYGISIQDYSGKIIATIWSPIDTFEAVVSRERRVCLTLNPCQIGPGEYTLGISIISPVPLEQVNSSERYDLLSRSFVLTITLPESLAPINCAFFHTGEWSVLEQGDDHAK